ncbi:hypothetical protein U1Q18_027372 [Sarracenia purpurea var. burkii]
MNDDLRVDLGRFKPTVGLGLLNKSPWKNLQKGTAQCLDPVRENSNQPVLGSDRASDESLPTRAQNWKRRAREAKGNPSQGSRNGGERKRKMEIDGGNENKDELEQGERRKKFRSGKPQTGRGIAGFWWRICDFERVVLLGSPPCIGVCRLRFCIWFRPSVVVALGGCCLGFGGSSGVFSGGFWGFGGFWHLGLSLKLFASGFSVEFLSVFLLVFLVFPWLLYLSCFERAEYSGGGLSFVFRLPLCVEFVWVEVQLYLWPCTSCLGPGLALHPLLPFWFPLRGVDRGLSPGEQLTMLYLFAVVGRHLCFSPIWCCPSWSRRLSYTTVELKADVKKDGSGYITSEKRQQWAVDYAEFAMRMQLDPYGTSTWQNFVGKLEYH